MRLTRSCSTSSTDPPPLGLLVLILLWWNLERPSVMKGHGSASWPQKGAIPATCGFPAPLAGRGLWGRRGSRVPLLGIPQPRHRACGVWGSLENSLGKSYSFTFIMASRILRPVYMDNCQVGFSHVGFGLIQRFGNSLKSSNISPPIPPKKPFKETQKPSQHQPSLALEGRWGGLTSSLCRLITQCGLLSAD